MGSVDHTVAGSAASVIAATNSLLATAAAAGWLWGEWPCLLYQVRGGSACCIAKPLNLIRCHVLVVPAWPESCQLHALNCRTSRHQSLMPCDLEIL